MTAGWLAEALATLYMAATVPMEPRARAAIQWLGLAAILLGTGGALLGPILLPSGGHSVLNRAFATEVGAGIALAAAIALFRRMARFPGPGPNGERTAAVLFLLLNVVLLVTSGRELGAGARRGGAVRLRLFRRDRRARER